MQRSSKAPRNYRISLHYLISRTRGYLFQTGSMDNLTSLTREFNILKESTCIRKIMRGESRIFIIKVHPLVTILNLITQDDTLLTCDLQLNILNEHFQNQCLDFCLIHENSIFALRKIGPACLLQEGLIVCEFDIPKQFTRLIASWYRLSVLYFFLIFKRRLYCDLFLGAIRLFNSY